MSIIVYPPPSMADDNSETLIESSTARTRLVSSGVLTPLDKMVHALSKACVSCCTAHHDLMKTYTLNTVSRRRIGRGFSFKLGEVAVHILHGICSTVGDNYYELGIIVDQVSQQPHNYVALAQHMTFSDSAAELVSFRFNTRNIVRDIGGMSAVLRESLNEIYQTPSRHRKQSYLKLAAHAKRLALTNDEVREYVSPTAYSTFNLDLR